jgi:hypothetical protein
MYPGREQPMSDRAPSAAFRFFLPPALLLRTPPGRWHPCIHGVRLDVGADGGVTIGGYDAMESHARRAVLDQAVRFLDLIAADNAPLPPATAAAELVRASAADRPELYQITFGARIALARRERWHGVPLLVA